MNTLKAVDHNHLFSNPSPLAKKCLIVPKLQRMFPRTHQNHDMDKRRSEYYQVKRGLTETEEVSHSLYAEIVK